MGQDAEGITKCEIITNFIVPNIPSCLVKGFHLENITTQEIYNQ